VAGGQGGEYTQQCDNMKPRIVLIGGGGHCKSCIDVIELEAKYTIAGIVDIKEKLRQSALGYKILATDNDLPDLVKEYQYFFITLGQIKSPDKRIRIFQILRELGARLPVMISPLSYVSKYAEIGDGTIIMHHALINAGAKIGNNCIINNKALIEHDAIIDAVIGCGGTIIKNIPTNTSTNTNT
jgi:sugar O-acyltransferase (sialic acid O-acetyltransferase NeuD family)